MASSTARSVVRAKAGEVWVSTFRDITHAQKRRVVDLYNEKWFNLQLLERAFEKTSTPKQERDSETNAFSSICVNQDYFEERSELFPEGQLVAIKDGEVVGSLVTIPSRISALEEVPTTYGRLHRRYVADLYHQERGGWRVIFCISIVSAAEGVVDALFSRIGEVAGDALIMPYSAPRSLRRYFIKKPSPDEVQRYLMTSYQNSKSLSIDVEDYLLQKYGAFSPLPGLLRSLSTVSVEVGINEDFIHWFSEAYGQKPTFTDFLLLTNRRPQDSIMAFHLLRGADFVLSESAPMLFENSRPADVMAHGYNVLLTYSKLPDSLR